MESSLTGVPLSATQMAPKAASLTSGIRAPLTIDESDFEYSAASKSRRNSIGSSSYYSNSELESEGFVSGEDEEFLEETHFLPEDGVYNKPSVVKLNGDVVQESSFNNEYGFSVKNPDENFAQDSGNANKNAIFRPFAGNPDEKISKGISDVNDSDDSWSFLSESGDELVEDDSYVLDNSGSRPIMGVMDKENLENGPTPNLEIKVPFVQTLHIPIAKISRDSDDDDDDDSHGSEILEDEGFLGIVRVPSVDVLRRVDSALKVRISEADEGDDNESKAENMVKMEFVEDLVINNGDLGPKDENEHIGLTNAIDGVVSSDTVEDRSPDVNEEDKATSLVVDEQLNSLSESGQNGDFMQLDQEIQEIYVTDDLNKCVDLVDEDTKSSNAALEDNLVFDRDVASEKVETESEQEIELTTEDSFSFIDAHKMSTLYQCVDSKLVEEITKEVKNGEMLHNEVKHSTFHTVTGVERSSPLEALSEREKNKLEKIQKIRVKYLRLIHRLGCFPGDSATLKVLHQLSMAERRSSSQIFHIDLAENAAMDLEAQSKDDLDFSLCILVMGKTGVGKSSIINSIFGEIKTKVNAFEPSTARVKEIVCKIDGVKVKIFDTPGLRTSSINQPFNQRILSSIKKLMQKSPPDVILYVDRLDAQFSNLNDLPLLKFVVSYLGSSIWQKSIIAFTHANSVPPDGPNGYPLSYMEFIAQQSRAAQQLISQSSRTIDGSMIPVSLMENHPFANKNENGETLLHNGERWRSNLLLSCYSMKILSELSSLVEVRNPLDHFTLLFRYCLLEPCCQVLTRTVFNSYRDFVVIEDNLDIVRPLPAVISIRLTKDEKSFKFQLHSPVGDKGLTLTGLDNQTFGKNKNFVYNLKGDLNVNVSVDSNKKLSGKVSAKTRCSDQLQLAAMVLLPIAKAVFDKIFG